MIPAIDDRYNLARLTTVEVARDLRAELGLLSLTAHPFRFDLAQWIIFLDAEARLGAELIDEALALDALTSGIVNLESSFPTRNMLRRAGAEPL